MLLALLLAAAAPQPGAIKGFKDWLVGCDNGRACQAVGLASEGGPTSGIVVVQRGPSPSDGVSILIRVYEGAPAAAVIDGRRFPLVAARDEDGWHPSDPDAFIRAMLTAKHARLVDAGGSPVAELKTSGVIAALLYMDEQQRRIGTPGALVRKGSGTSSAPPPLPVVVSATVAARPLTVPQQEIDRLARATGCAEEMAGLDRPLTVETSALDAGHSLVLMSCGSGAYNFLSVPLIAARTGTSVRLERARFDRAPVWVGDGGEAILVNSGWDAKTGTLDHYAKGRGLGDCGQAQSWVWGGSSFLLIEEREMPECRGSVDWIRTWRAQVKRR